MNPQEVFGTIARWFGLVLLGCVITGCSKSNPVDEYSEQLIGEAKRAAREGRLDKARGRFERITSATTNVDVLLAATEFYYQIGDLTKAEELIHRSQHLIGPDAQSIVAVRNLTNLGLIYETRGDLDRAEEIQTSTSEGQANTGCIGQAVG